jgi:ribose transport system substrate-binding protein
MSKKIINLLTVIVTLSIVLSLSIGVFAKTTVGVSLLTREHVYYNFLENYLKEEAKKLDVDIIIMDGKFDSNNQMNQVQDFITSGVDAILLSPASISGAEGSYKLAKNAGIPIFTFDVSAPGDFIAHVGTDNFKGGEIAGKYMAENVLKDQTGKVVIVTYSEIEACVFREEGFCKAVSKYPNIEVIDIQNCSGSMEKAANVTQDMLLKYDDIDALFGVGDPFAMGAYQVIRAEGRDIPIVAFDGNPEGLAEIKKGGIWKADVAQNPKKVASTVLNYAVDYINGKEVPHITLVEPFIIDINNVEQYMK